METQSSLMSSRIHKIQEKRNDLANELIGEFESSISDPETL